MLQKTSDACWSKQGEDGSSLGVHGAEGSRSVHPERNNDKAVQVLTGNFKEEELLTFWVGIPVASPQVPPTVQSQG